MKKRDLIILVCLIIAVVAVTFFIYRLPLADEPRNILEESNNVEELSEKQKFINSTISFAEKIAYSKEEIEYPDLLQVEGSWQVSVDLYSEGKLIGRASSDKAVFAEALKEGVESALVLPGKDLTFSISLSNSLGEVFSFVGKEGEGKETIGNLVLVFNVDKDLIKEKMKEGRDFLLRMEDPQTHGFYKLYEAPDDILPSEVHTVYTSSIVYTFLYLNDLEEDKEILDSLSRWGEFLLSMQNKKENQAFGAFHYSYDLSTNTKENNFVVGTSALTIFTLLRMEEVTGNPKYLEAAKLAGNWLITMQEEDGSIGPYIKYDEEGWFSGNKESLLYNGQSLSALSKLYQRTGEEKYYLAASKTAQRFVSKYEQAQGYIVGEYREENPISNAWAVMSLLDFCKAKDNEYYKTVIFELIDLILENQIKDGENYLDYGQWEGAYSTSGIGWISEVTGEVYRLCLEENREDCSKYKEAVLRGIRWIIQRTYNENNSFLLKNPERAEGGVFWNNSYRYIRTDSICHGVNSYARIFNYLEPEDKISLPERSLEKILSHF